MATVKFKTGTKTQLNSKAVENGAVYITSDTNELAVDLDNKRIFVSPEMNLSSSKDVETALGLIFNR